MQQFSELPPLSLYIHFPWCVEKCPYCDFNSHALKDELPEQDYVAALLMDLDAQLPSVWGRTLHSIFMGGGTPSLFSVTAMESLMSGLRARLNFAPSIEITMEANPGTVEQDKFKGFYDVGINRISIGVQSFNNRHLKQLGRIHNAREAIKAIEVAHKAGIDKINTDLMYGLPDQTVGEARGDLQMALALGPTHVSHYQLTIEPNTLFHHQPPLLPDEDRLIEIEENCREYLADNDFERYEISAYAKPEQRCEHNLNYWLYGDYLGIGAGAHGKLTDAHQQCITRRWNIKNPRDYLAAKAPEAFIAGQSQPTEQETTFEFMLNALRLIDGFDSELIQQRCGFPISTIDTLLQQAEEKELIDWGLKTIKPTEHGLQYLNNLTEIFLPKHSDD